MFTIITTLQLLKREDSSMRCPIAACQLVVRANYYCQHADVTRLSSLQLVAAFSNFSLLTDNVILYAVP